jgi:hypothetical protein
LSNEKIEVQVKIAVSADFKPKIMFGVFAVGRDR